MPTRADFTAASHVAFSRVGYEEKIGAFAPFAPAVGFVFTAAVIGMAWMLRRDEGLPFQGLRGFLLACVASAIAMPAGLALALAVVMLLFLARSGELEILLGNMLRAAV